MKRFMITIFIFLLANGIVLGQESLRKAQIDSLVSVPHGMYWPHSDEIKKKINEVLNNITLYQKYLEIYIEAGYDNSQDTESIRKAQNAIYLLANSKGNAGNELLIRKYDEIGNKIALLNKRLASFQGEMRADSTAILLRRQANSSILLRRTIIKSFNQTNSPQLQEKVLSGFRKMDFASQLVSLKYLSEVKSTNEELEKNKYQELEKIYRDKGQFLFNSEILKAVLDKQ